MSWTFISSESMLVTFHFMISLSGSSYSSDASISITIAGFQMIPSQYSNVLKSVLGQIYLSGRENLMLT